MSLLPYILGEPYDRLMRPSRILDQHFGLPLDPEDFLTPMTRMVIRCPAGYVRTWRSSASQRDVGSTVISDKDKFQANLDVQQFKPEEISVKISGENAITIEGKHEEQPDEHGHIYRHFIRKYILPKDCDINKVESKLSSDGVLTISAPKTGIKTIEQREIPVTQTGAPATQIELKRESDEMESEQMEPERNK